MHLKIKKPGGKENKVEVWEWSIKLDLKLKKWSRHLKLMKLWWRNLEVIQGEVKDNWKRRNLKLKFEVKQVWLMKFRAKEVKIEET